MLRYEETPPPPALRPFVQTLWAFSAAAPAAPVHHVPPDGCVSVVVGPSGPGGGATLVGPHLAALTVPIRPGDRFEGVRMCPEAAGVLCGIAPRAWVGRTAPLAEASPALAAALEAGDAAGAHARLLAALTARAATAPAPDPLVGAAVAAIEGAPGDARVAALARGLGTSVRTLQRRFLAATGLSPKAYARVRRFRHALANLLRTAPDAWGRVAADHGFADQAHLTRECAAFMGLPPTELSVLVRRIEHVGVTP